MGEKMHKCSIQMVFDLFPYPPRKVACMNVHNGFMGFSQFSLNEGSNRTRAWVSSSREPQTAGTGGTHPGQEQAGRPKLGPSRDASN